MYQFLKIKARKEYHYFPIITNKDKAIRILFYFPSTKLN